MSGSDIFGDPGLFAEFEREREPSDRILLAKFNSPEKSTENGVKRCNTDDSDSDSSVSDNGEYRDDAVNPAGWEGTSHMSEDMLRKIDDLERKNRRLERCYRMIDGMKYTSCKEAPAIQVLFMNNKFARKYKAEIENFISNLLYDEKQKANERMPEVRTRPNTVWLVDEEQMNDVSTRQNIREHAVLSCSQLYDDFIMDGMGWPLVDYNPQLTDSWETPNYSPQFTHTLPVDSDDEDSQAAKRARPKFSCFNCDGDHNLAQCPERRDHARINKRRQEFKVQMGAAGNGAGNRRPIEDSPRFSKYKAGTISDSLREALGLHKDELPPYIYQMRVFGYPPGHLKNAEVVSSGLSMFGKDGQELSMEGELLEDGEVDQLQQPAVQYDFGKLVDYPGFNQPVPPGVMDEHRKYGLPEMQSNQRRSVLEVFLSPKATGRKRKHSEDTRRNKRQKSDKPAEDMEIEDSEIESDNPASQYHSQTSSRAASTCSSRQSSRPDTPSLEELEQQQLLIMKQLQAAEGEEGAVEMAVIDSVEESANQDDNNSSFVPPVPPTPERPPLPTDTPPLTPKADTSFVPPIPPTPPCQTPPPLPKDTPPRTPVFVPPVPPTPPCQTPPPLPKGTPPCTPNPSSASTPVPSNGSTRSMLKSQDTLVLDPESSGLQTPETHMALSTPGSGSLSREYGTPLCRKESQTPVSLPNPEKFSQGIADHIPYENLPDATGKFLKMRSLLQTLREKKGDSTE